MTDLSGKAAMKMDNVINFEVARSIKAIREDVETLRDTHAELLDKLQSINMMTLSDEDKLATVRSMAKLKSLDALDRDDVRAAIELRVSQLGRDLTPDEGIELLKSLAPEAFAVHLC